MADYQRDHWEERWLLGAILRFGDSHYKPSAWLEPQDFITRKHQLVWRALGKLSKDGAPVDRLAVYRELERAGELAEVGGLTGLLDIEPNAPEIIDPFRLAKSIRSLRSERELYVAFDSLATEASLHTEPPESLMRLAEDKIQNVRELTPETSAIALGQAVNASNSIETFLEKPSVVIYGPWESFRRVGGFKRGEFWIVAARPSMGKTAWALNLALGAAREGRAVAFFTMEMPVEMILRRVYSAMAMVDLHDITSGELTDSEKAEIFAAQAELEHLPLYVFDTKINKIAAIRTISERGCTFQKEHRKFDLIIVDYVGLIQERGENRNAEITAISTGLKAISADIQSPVVALCQLNRQVEMRADKRPVLSDLRDSGSLEQDADVVSFIYREGYYKRNDPSVEHSAEFNILKHRNGPTPTFPMRFERRYGLFTDEKVDKIKETKYHAEESVPDDRRYGS